MSDTLDKLSYAGKLATDILFVRNPVGTSMGALLGIIIDGATSVLISALPAMQALKDSGISLFHYLAVGIFGFNVKTFLRKDEIDPKIKEALQFIENQVRQGRITRGQARLKFNEIITKVVENVKLDPTTAERLNKLAE